tara:strand:- start:1226 stop:1525 length:300 start_codon:yes stop_codon:yes gene_type:complete
MANSFKNLQNKLQALKSEITPDEPKRRAEALRYLNQLSDLIRDSYLDKSTSDYMFIKTISDSIVEVKYFGGFNKDAKERLRIIEQRYNYIYEQDGSDIE